MRFSFVDWSEIICSEVDDPENLKSIEGITLVWIEEPTEFVLSTLSVIGLHKQIFSLNLVSASLKRIFQRLIKDNTMFFNILC